MVEYRTASIEEKEELSLLIKLNTRHDAVAYEQYGCRHVL